MDRPSGVRVMEGTQTKKQKEKKECFKKEDRLRDFWDIKNSNIQGHLGVSVS